MENVRATIQDGIFFQEPLDLGVNRFALQRGAHPLGLSAVSQYPERSGLQPRAPLKHQGATGHRGSPATLPATTSHCQAGGSRLFAESIDFIIISSSKHTGQAPQKWSIAFGPETPKPQVYPRLEQSPESDLR